MAFAVGSATLVTLTASEVSTEREAYDPVTGDLPNASSMWNMPGTFYRLLEQREIIEDTWNGTRIAVANEMLRAFTYAAAYSLEDVPVFSQRLWTQFVFSSVTDMETDPGLSYLSGSEKFVWDSTSQELDCTWTTARNSQRGVLGLGGDISQDFSLRWEFRLTLTSADANSALLVGYFDEADIRLRNALAIGFKQGASDLVGFIGHWDSQGNITVSISGEPLALSTAYRVIATYDATSTIVSATIYDTGATLVSSTGTTAESVTGLTSQLTDSSTNFDDLGIDSGDVLVIDGVEYGILTANGNTVTTSQANMPAGATVAYTILGEQEADALLLDVAAEASDPNFTINAFGTANLDTRYVDGLLPTTGVYSKNMIGVIADWTYFNPVIPERILEIPSLQDSITAPTITLTQDIDYELEQDGAVTLIRFRDPVEADLWAEYTAYDERLIYSFYGSLVGLDDVSSDEYKSAVQGLYYAFWRGPTVEAVQLGVHIHLGLPIALEDGEVTGIQSYSGTQGLIVIGDRSYLYPLSLGTSLQVGDSVSRFDPLCRGVQVDDYINNPHWWIDFSDFNELEKYHSFRVLVSLEAFDAERLVTAAAFVDQLRPTWKSDLYTVYTEQVDSLTVQDDVTIALTLSLYDSLSGILWTAYDVESFGFGTPDTSYDAGFNEWSNDPPGYARGLAKLYPGTGTVEVTVSDTEITGTGTSFTTDIGAAGIIGNTLATAADGDNSGPAQILDSASGTFLTDIPLISGTGYPLYVTYVRIASDDQIYKVLEVQSDTRLLIQPDGPGGTGLSYTVFHPTKALILAQQYSGSGAVYTAGDQVVTVPGITGFGKQPRVGDTLTLDGVDDFLIQAISGTDITVGTAPVTSGTTTWTLTRAWQNADTWTWIGSVIDADTLHTGVEAVLSIPTDFQYAVVDAANIYTSYDQLDELTVDEQLEIDAVISYHYNQPPAGTINWPDGSNTITGDGTVDFEALFSAVGSAYPGTVPGVTSWIQLEDGTSARIVGVISPTQIVSNLTNTRGAAITGVASALQNITAPRIQFTSGLNTATASASITGIINVNDYITMVQTLNTSTPLVYQVTAIGGGGINLTLDRNADRNYNNNVQVMGPSPTLPRPVVGWGGSPSSFTDWKHNASGGETLTYTDPEPVFSP